MLYEMLTGQRAFRGDTRASTIASILREEPKPISQVTESMPRETEKIIIRCLRKDAERRFQYMKDVKVELEELKEEYETGKVTETLQATKGHRTLIWAATALNLVLAVSLVVWFRGARSPAVGACSAEPVDRWIDI